ncbi:hypothetical protein WIV_gp028 [Wiseana iridescent virus]|uniref:Uncharacterized protein n=1 Tax=Wiseana iridescent virus TaxID=68347 RepID=G0T554_IRV9|nr:hypothetical protein WIV_gp028 [Wiseana iridescent virus]ADO00371.1 hypothetical protein [Wiseana iridescent virus]
MYNKALQLVVLQEVVLIVAFIYCTFFPKHHWVYTRIYKKLKGSCTLNKIYFLKFYLRYKESLMVKK